MLGDEDLQILAEEKLVEKAKVSSSAFGYLYKKYVNKIHNFIFYKTFDKELTEDLTHTVFVKVLENIKKYKNTGQGFRAWIFRITRNTIIDFYRRKKEQRLSEEQKRNLFQESNFLEKMVSEEEEKEVLEEVL